MAALLVDYAFKGHIYRRYVDRSHQKQIGIL